MSNHNIRIKRLKKSAGRDKSGHISIRHRGGGAKRLYRAIETLDNFLNQKAKVIAVEYDPNRSANLALLQLASGRKIYVLAAEGLKIGQEIEAGEKVALTPGNRLPLKNIPSGLAIFDLEMQPRSGAKIVRSAGLRAIILAKEAGTPYVQVKLPSGEIRRFHGDCFATIGTVSNPSHMTQKISKAGIRRWLGKRPTVRGKAMHPASHPHGGGEGVNPIGLKYPKTPWGKPARGKKTRKNKPSDKMIIKRRK